jgi:integrase
MAQSGCFYRASNAWHVRYYATHDGVRIQKSRRVCDGSKSKAEARLQAADFLAQINADDSADTPVEAERTIAEFWTAIYEPYVAKHKRANTVHSYRAIWKKHLKTHFGDRELRGYQTHEATKFLSKLAEKRGQRTVQHVRSLMSGIYSHAVAIGACKSNPIADAKILGDLIAPGVTTHYTLEEAENIISALVDHVDAQLIFALSYFAGLRPGEINALDWTDFDTEFVHVRRAIGRGVVAEPKTKKSIRSIPLIAPVRVPLELWRRKSGGPKSGWVFPNGDSQPINLTKHVERFIKPALEAKGITAFTLYAGRRGFATILRDLTGASLAGRDALGHVSTATTEAHYEKVVPEAVLKGMRLLEAKSRNI